MVDGLLRQHVPDRKVLAFGSRATWTAKDYSDLDLAILGDEPLSSEAGEPDLVGNRNAEAKEFRGSRRSNRSASVERVVLYLTIFRHDFSHCYPLSGSPICRTIPSAAEEKCRDALHTSQISNGLSGLGPERMFRIGSIFTQSGSGLMA